MDGRKINTVNTVKIIIIAVTNLCGLRKKKGFIMIWEKSNIYPYKAEDSGERDKGF